MHEYRDYMRSDDDRPQRWLGISSVTQALLVATVATYFALLFLAYVILPFGFRVAGFELTALQTVGLVPRRAAGEMPPWLWQFVTYGLFHHTQNILQVLFNCINLYFFGREIETLYGPRRFLLLYFGGIAFGGLAYSLFFYDSVAPLAGADAGVFAVMVAYAFHYPRQQVVLMFLIPLQVWFLVSVLVGIEIAFAVRFMGSPAFAYLAGAIFGMLFYRLQHHVDAYLDRLERRMRRAEREHEEELEAKLDTLLEKISRDGMDSLTKKERDFLKRASSHYQKKS